MTTLKIKLASLALLPVLLVATWFWLNFLQGQSTAVTELTPTEVQIAPDQTKETIAGKPASIIVPSQNINLQVADGVYNQNNGAWTLSNDKAHFALISQNANNQAGNTFIYGHNSNRVFQKLGNVKVGDVAEILTDNGYRFTYKYRRSVDVSPRDTDIFRYQGPAILTLQTCSGLWDQNRQLLTFDFVKVEKI